MKLRSPSCPQRSITTNVWLARQLWVTLWPEMLPYYHVNLATKAKINTWDYVKLKSFCSKGNHQQNERATMGWEKTPVYHVFDKGLKSEIYRELKQLSFKQTIQLKNGRVTDKIYSQRYSKSQRAYEKMLNITNHQGNTNENYNEISAHTCQDGHHQKDHK